MAWLTAEKFGQEDFSEREQLADILRCSESIFRDANPAKLQNLLLKELEIKCLLKRDLN